MPDAFWPTRTEYLVGRVGNGQVPIQTYRSIPDVEAFIRYSRRIDAWFPATAHGSEYVIVEAVTTYRIVEAPAPAPDRRAKKVSA